MTDVHGLCHYLNCLAIFGYQGEKQLQSSSLVFHMTLGNRFSVELQPGLFLQSELTTSFRHCPLRHMFHSFDSSSTSGFSAKTLTS